MRQYEIRKTQYAVSDFLSWQREGSLDLSPPFQRRSVWKPDAKSYFLDTVVRGLPAPVIYLRQRLDLSTQKTIREVVDGQQRLRTLFAFIDPHVLEDFDPRQDKFLIKSTHNKALAGKPFSKLEERYRESILSYEFSTHILPVGVEDREVLAMFARLNATGVKLNPQELRNAEWFGEFKSSMYELAFEQFNRWREWRVLTDDQISRMKEVEVTSDLVANMIYGLMGKTQSRLDKIYEDLDEEFPSRAEVERRFRLTMEEIEKLLGDDIAGSAFSSEVNFFSLFVLVYEYLYGLGSPLKRTKGKALPSGMRSALLKISERFSTQNVPKSVLDAVQRASADFGRREKRLKYMKRICDGEAG